MCIRDRVSTQSTWGQQLKQKHKKMRSVILLALCITVLSTTYYDRCNPEWVKIIQDGQLFDCASPGQRNPILEAASGATAIGNMLNAYPIKINGQNPTPAVVYKYLEKGFGKIDELRKLFQALGLTFEIVKGDHLQKKVDEILIHGIWYKQYIIVSKKTGEFGFFYGGDNGTRYFVNSRGQSEKLGKLFNGWGSLREAIIFTKP
eukprot:TRINITY_DN2806_c0_g1_i2.p1 TRINITY_DN2806_c0_g1~~TRINITY_DN2806_c0_g1_i2.p1  ORF type:complete len:236 (+),score=74.65 TRINITY_DN2806_c0_g1_i2:99-710(+)